MTNPELPDLSRESPDKRHRLSLPRRGRRLAIPLSRAVSSQNPRAEKTNLDLHQEAVAAQMRTLFDAIGAGVARSIGYEGNIREELRSRLAPNTSHGHTLNTDGLHPALGRYLQHDIFFFRLDNEQGGPAAIYSIDCQVGFSPSILVETSDGSLEASLFTGPDHNQFHRARLRRTYNDDRVKTIDTFPPSYKNAYDPPHPLVIQQGFLPMPASFMIYEHADKSGNVSLLDGQTVRDANGTAGGRYSAAARGVATNSIAPFPASEVNGRLIIGQPGQQISFPVQTNIYTELQEMTKNIPSITPGL